MNPSSVPHDSLSPLRASARAALALLALCANARVASATPQAPTNKSVPAVRVDTPRLPEHLAQQSAALTYFDLVSLSTPADLERPFSLELQYEGQAYTLDVERVSVRSGSFQVLEAGPDGILSEVDPGPIRTFQGRVREDHLATVVGALLPTGLEARVELPDGRTLMVEPFYEAFAAGARDQFVVFEHDATLHDHEARCSAVGESVPGPAESAAGPNTACGSEFCVAEVAFDVDNSFYQYWGSDTSTSQAVTEYLVLLANMQFIRDVEIRHLIGNLVVRAAGDPASYASAASLVDLTGAFGAHWNANHTGFLRDTAHLLTRRFAGGFAFIGVVCNTGMAYGASGLGGSYGLNCNANVLAHELGHNWGAGHCACDGVASPAYTMNATYPPCALRFNPTGTIPTIRAFRNSRTCLRGGVINDRRADAIEVAPTSTTQGDTTAATADGTASCGASNASPDVWYYYRPSANGTLVVMTCNGATNFDTVLSVQAANGAELACSDDATCGVSNLQSVLSVPVTGGQIYYIRVAGYSGAVGRFGLRMESGPGPVPPFNDYMASALEIGPGVYYGSTYGATLDGSAPCSAASGPDVWFSYTPARHGLVTIDTCGSDDPASGGSLMRAVLSVHNSGFDLGCNASYCGTGARVEFQVSPGVTYLIRLAGMGGTAGGYRLSLAGPEVINDVCISARPVRLGTRYVTLSGAYASDGTPVCTAGTAGEPTLFYTFTNTEECAGVLQVRTCGTHDLRGTDRGVDTVLSAHSSCPAGPSNALACSSNSFSCAGDAGVKGDALIEVNLEPNDSVVIQLTRYNATHGDQPIVLTSQFTLGGLPPFNDSCANAVAVDTGLYVGNLCGATNDGSATCGESEFAPDVWYRYTAPAVGRLKVSTCGTNDMPGHIDTVLSLHADVCPGTIDSQLACDDDSTMCGLADQGAMRDSLVSTPVLAGQSVLIRVATHAGQRPGRFLLNVTFELGHGYCPPSPNSATSGAVIEAFGSPSLSANNFRLSVTQAPANKPGLFYLGLNQINVPFGEGRGCVGGIVRRIPSYAITNSFGTTQRVLDFNFPYGAVVFAGAPGVNYQYWFRDAGVDSDGDGTIENFNVSTAINVVHTP